MGRGRRGVLITDAYPLYQLLSCAIVPVREINLRTARDHKGGQKFLVLVFSYACHKLDGYNGDPSSIVMT